MSNPTEEEWKKIGKLVDTFYHRVDAQPFRDPVPWKQMGLTDYPQIIKQPMDLGTIRDKIKSRKYSTLSQVASDVRLVWSNCMTYNADGSDFYKLADSLRKKWDDKYTKLLHEIGANTSNTTAGPSTTGSGAATAQGDTTGATKASLQDKRSFAKSLYLITKEDLGRVLVDVENKCPAAIKRNSAEDEYELNIDELPVSVLQELNTFVNSVKGKKKKTASSATGNKKAKTAT